MHMLSDHTPKIRTFPRRISGEEAVVGVDLQLERLAPIESLPWVNSLRVTVEEGDGEDELLLDPDMAYGEEPNAFAPIFDGGQHGAVLVGLVSTPETAEWFVYSSEPCAELLAEAIDQQFARLNVEGSSRRDADWSVYREFLRPSLLERNLIENRAQIHELEEHDISLDTPIQVAHTVWFSAPGDRNAFAEKVADRGFELHYPDEDMPIDADNGDDVAYGLTISRHETVDAEQMDELVRVLFKEAASLGGDYEGWHVEQ